MAEADLYRRVLQKRAKSFAEVFSEGDLEMSFEAQGHLDDLAAKVVSGNYYESLGIRATLGRTLTEDDNERAIPYPAVLSDSSWRRYFGARTTVIGETVRLRSIPFVVVGVLPRTFRGMDIDGAGDVAIPVAAYNLWTPGIPSFRAPVQIFGRLAPGVSIQQARAELKALWSVLIDAELENAPALSVAQQQEYRAKRTAIRVDLQPVSGGVSLMRGQFAGALKILMGSVGVLLALICCNIAGLVLARGEVARKEIAIRLSLGATHFRIAMQLILDAFLLSLTGTIGAMATVSSGGRLLTSSLVPKLPLAETLPDGRVFVFLLFLTVITTVAISVVPVLNLLRADLTGLMGRGGSNRRRSPAWTALLALQVTLSTVLLITGIALVLTLNRLRTSDLGENRRNLIVMMIRPEMAGAKPEEGEPIIAEAVRASRAMRGVEGVSVTGFPQMRGFGMKLSVAPDGTTDCASRFSQYDSSTG